jgi:hypothetical protein
LHLPGQVEEREIDDLQKAVWGFAKFSSCLFIMSGEVAKYKGNPDENRGVVLILVHHVEEHLGLLCLDKLLCAVVVD